MVNWFFKYCLIGLVWFKFGAPNPSQQQEKSHKIITDELHRAVVVADFKQVEKILRRDPDLIIAGQVPLSVNRLDSQYRRTALMMCGYDPQSESSRDVDIACVRIAKALKQAGANLSYVDERGWDALHMAAVRGLSKFCKYLVLNSNFPGSTPLSTTTTVTVESSQQTAPDLTTSSSSSSSYVIALDRVDEDGRTALMKAVLHGHVSTAATLAKLGSDCSVSDSYRATALHYAVQAAAVNSTQLSLLTALLHHCNASNFRHLSPHPSSPTASSPSSSPAASASASASASSLSSSSSSSWLDLMTDLDGRTPLMYALLGSADVVVVQELLRHGSRPDARDKFGVSAQNMYRTREVQAVLVEHIAAQLEAQHEIWLKSQDMELELEAVEEEEKGEVEVAAN